MKTLIRKWAKHTSKAGCVDELTDCSDDKNLLTEVERFEDLFENEKGVFTDCDGNFEFTKEDFIMDFDDYIYMFRDDT